jgi:NAD(P)H dehydrogenase (quinone)
VDEFRAVLPPVGERPTIPFNRKDEWGEDGRIVPGAPVYSPFIRRKQHLELE